MKISQLISKLEEIKKENSDLEVALSDNEFRIEDYYSDLDLNVMYIKDDASYIASDNDHGLGKILIISY